MLYFQFETTFRFSLTVEGGEPDANQFIINRIDRQGETHPALHWKGKISPMVKGGSPF